MGVTDLALGCESEPVMDAVCTAVFGPARTGHVLDAGSDREDRSTYATLATHDGHSLKKDDDSMSSLPNYITSHHYKVFNGCSWCRLSQMPRVEGVG